MIPDPFVVPTEVDEAKTVSSHIPPVRPAVRDPLDFVPKDLHLIYPKLADNVRRAQGAAGYTQTQLARQVGVTRGSITNLVGRKQGVSIGLLYRIATACDVQVCDLLND